MKDAVWELEVVDKAIVVRTVWRVLDKVARVVPVMKVAALSKMHSCGSSCSSSSSGGSETKKSEKKIIV